MRCRNAFAAALLFLAGSVLLPAQSLSLRVTPGLNVPLMETAELYNLGGSLFMSGEYVFSSSFPAFAFVSAEYSLDPIKSTDLVHSISGSLGGGFYFDIIPQLKLQAFAGGGYYYSLLSDAGEIVGGGNPHAFGGLGLHYLLSPMIDVGAGVSYRYLFGLYNGLQVFVGTSIYLSGTEPRRLKIESEKVRPSLLQAKAPDPGKGVDVSSFSVDPIFPVFRNYYDDHAIGRAVLVNQEKSPVTALKASLFVRKYMDGPRQLDVPSELGAGAKADMDLFALFSSTVMDITEGEKASAELTLEYKVNGVPYADTRTRTITLYNRNAMTWEDDRRAAAFVTRFDPIVQEYAKNMLAAIDGLGSEVVDKTLLSAIGAHQTLLLAGLKYSIDPKSSYAEQVSRKQEVDYLQFPRQTLQRKGGDCDDLSILYCALLESVGIPTAFVTVPGHIFMAFALDIDPDDVGKTFYTAMDLFEKDGKVWVPIEVTERSGGFVKAWKSGAREWRQSVSSGSLGFFPLETAWKTYAPVQSPETSGEAVSVVSLPSTADIAKSVETEVAAFRDGEVAPQVAALQKQLDPKTGNPRIQNKIGILYARYGFYSKAEAEFQNLTSSEKTAFLPALVNLGNIYFLREDYAGALKLYSQAAKKDPADVTVQFCLARASYALGRYDEARTAMAMVRKSDPQLAERFSFMETQAAGTARAGDAAKLKGGTVWDE